MAMCHLRGALWRYRYARTATKADPTRERGGREAGCLQQLILLEKPPLLPPSLKRMALVTLPDGPLEIQSQRVQHSMIGLGAFKVPPGPS